MAKRAPRRRKQHPRPHVRAPDPPPPPGVRGWLDTVKVWTEKIADVLAPVQKIAGSITSIIMILSGHPPK